VLANGVNSYAIVIISTCTAAHADVGPYGQLRVTATQYFWVHFVIKFMKNLHQTIQIGNPARILHPRFPDQFLSHTRYSPPRW